MGIWMDMTHTLVNWQGGVVGIVRVELEIAQKLKRLHPEIRFCVHKDSKIEEIPGRELEWLFNAENVTEAYLVKMGRTKDNASTSSKEKKADKSELPQLAEAYSYSLSRKERLKQSFRLVSRKLPKVLRIILKVMLSVIFSPIILFMYIRTKLIRHKEKKRTRKEFFEIESVENTISKRKNNHPFSDEDVLFCCGWIDLAKFHAFEIIKRKTSNFKIVHFVYDLIPILLKFLWDSYFYLSFVRHFEWISHNCDIILYGGKTAQKDGIIYQKANGLDMPFSKSVKLGTERFHTNKKENSKTVLKDLGISDNFILTTGTFEPRKNYDTVYKAYVFLSETLSADRIPQLVIIGKVDPMYGCMDLFHIMSNDPRIVGKVILISPTDEQLDVLYQLCSFFILSTFYEGWSLTLPEALAYGKFCIVSDVPPLRDIGEDFVDYVDPTNPLDWAKRIAYFVENPVELEKRNSRIRNNWKVISWENCAQQIMSQLSILDDPTISPRIPSVYFNFTTVWLYMNHGGGLSGIIRTNIALAREFKKIFPNMVFYSLSNYGYKTIEREFLNLLLGENPIEHAYEETKRILRNNLNTNDNATDPKISRRQQIEISKRVRRKDIVDAFWLFCSVLPGRLQNIFTRICKRFDRSLPITQNTNDNDDYSNQSNDVRKIILPFEKNSVVFSAAFDEDMFYQYLVKKREEIGFHFCQVLYDFTPIITPHLHKKETVRFNTKFFEFAYTISDIIFYGGETAMSDGIKYQREKNYPECINIPVKFGNDIMVANKNNKDSSDYQTELRKMGISDSFILTVGTIEPRKNQETLYKAYLRLLDKGIEPPQLVIAGNKGWNTDDFVNTLNRDERVARKIIMLSPSDYQLDIMYRHCMFTILASHYEGWSLTLPESLGYGKFCLTADVAPLREVGGDLVEYIHPFDTAKWADRIAYYAENPQEIVMWEQKIKDGWRSTTWKECAEFMAAHMIKHFGNE